MSGIDDLGLPSRGEPYIEHYYGDVVRQLFMVASAVTLIAVPLYAELLPYAPIVEIVAVVCIVAFAALTNPYRIWTIAGDTIIAAVGLFAFEILAVNAYIGKSIFLFTAREALALIFLFALYFSAKTLRAMWLHQIGKRTVPSDFEEKVE